mgnify:CR=1 FL=1
MGYGVFEDCNSTNLFLFLVHIKDLRVVRVQQRTFDKKYEYIFEVRLAVCSLFEVHEFCYQV